MPRLIIVSNRVPVKSKSGALPAGGLASALYSALQQRSGIWFGWSGKEQPNAEKEIMHNIHSHKEEAIEYLLLDLSKKDIEDYYAGFSNRVLWPLCHYRLDLIKYRQKDMLGYFRVNRLFAQKLYPLLKKEDTIWIHDYHLIPLASELRQLGVKNPIGFFMHIPWPSWTVFFTLPIWDILLRGLMCYDLIGFQTENDLDNFNTALKRSDLAQAIGENRYRNNHWQFKANVFPIGIDPTAFCCETPSEKAEERLKNFQQTLKGKNLIIGVDRLDYSKGITQRMQAYEKFIAHNPGSHGKVTFLQITPKSRSDVPEYSNMQKHVAQIAGQINGTYGHIDWTPIRYVNQSFSHEILKNLYRQAKLALVTPLRDGMNLVAKEFVAAQDPSDPALLILSRFAGAAGELKGALLVNPYDLDSLAQAISAGLSMPLEERINRWRPMYEHLSKHNISQWTENFLAQLQECATTRTLN